MIRIFIITFFTILLCYSCGKKNDPDLCNNIDTLKNQILYNQSNEIQY